MKNLIRKLSSLDQSFEQKTNYPNLRPKFPLRIRIRKLLRSFIPPNELKNKPLKNQ